MKIIKDTAILTAFIFISNFIIKLIFNLDNITKEFEEGVWAGLGTYLFSMVTLFLIIFLILLVFKNFFKPRNENEEKGEEEKGVRE